MLRPGYATLPCTYLLNYGIRRCLKTKILDGRDPPVYLSTYPLKVCRASISPTHKISYNAHSILKDRSHVLYLPTRKRFQAILDGRYDAREEGLWLAFTSNPMQKKRVIRSWASRRIEQALTGALRMRGFDRNGKRLVDRDPSTFKQSESNGSQVSSTREDTPEALIGTVEVQILEDSIGASFAEVQRQAEVMVDNILRICGRYPCNGSYNRQQKLGTTPYGMIHREESSWKRLKLRG